MPKLGLLMSIQLPITEILWPAHLPRVSTLRLFHVPFPLHPTETLELEVPVVHLRAVLFPLQYHKRNSTDHWNKVKGQVHEVSDHCIRCCSAELAYYER